MKTSKLKVGQMVQLKGSDIIVTVVGMRPSGNSKSGVEFDGVVIASTGYYKVGALESGFDPDYFKKYVKKDEK